jgi:signal transduction histidine kinase
LRFAKQSSTRRAGLLVALFVVAAAVATVGLAVDLAAVVAVGLALAVVAGGSLALFLIVTERRRHELVEEELTSEARFLEGLIESMRAVAATLDEAQVLEQARIEAERLLGARAAILAPGEKRPAAPAETTLEIPIRIRDDEAGILRLGRTRPFERGDVIGATLLADFAARSAENARLLAEATVRDAERSRLSDQLLTAEQDERRRLALHLHDTSVQSLSGIALLLDAALHSIEVGQTEEAKDIVTRALRRHRTTIGELRDLSFNLEPVVLRDQGFGTAVRELGDQLEAANRFAVDVDVAAAEGLPEQTQAALYQIVREAMNQAARRGPTRLAVRVRQVDGGEIETTIADDAPLERRRRSFEELAERARTLNGRLTVDQGDGAGTAVHVVLPQYAAAD